MVIFYFGIRCSGILTGGNPPELDAGIDPLDGCEYCIAGAVSDPELEREYMTSFTRFFAQECALAATNPPTRNAMPTRTGVGILIVAAIDVPVIAAITINTSAATINGATTGPNNNRGNMGVHLERYM